MRIGLALPHYDAPDREVTLDGVVEVARQADLLGFDSVWMSDHLVFDLEKYGGGPELLGSLEPLSTLAVLATETDGIRLGTMVLCNEFRPPAVVAKMATTIDRASGGRLDLGIGAGWYEREFRLFGLPFPRPRVRLERLEESVEILKGLFTGEPFTFSGKHYRLDEALALPRPASEPRPTIWVGGKGDRTVALAARVGDGWNAAWFNDPNSYRERARLLGDAPIRRSICQYAEGSPQQMLDRLAAFAELGVEETILCFGKVPFALDDPADVDRFAHEVLPDAHKL